MSWKLFGQIVLLMVVAALVLCILKCGMMHCKLGYKGKYLQRHMQHQQGLQK